MASFLPASQTNVCRASALGRFGIQKQNKIEVVLDFMELSVWECPSFLLLTHILDSYHPQNK